MTLYFTLLLTTGDLSPGPDPACVQRPAPDPAAATPPRPAPSWPGQAGPPPQHIHHSTKLFQSYLAKLLQLIVRTLPSSME